MNTSFPLPALSFPNVLAHHVARNGTKVFLTELATGRKWTFSELDAWSNRLANGLYALGVAHGTHVGLLMGNCAEHLALFLALGKLGAVYVPVNTAARGELLRYYFAHASVRLVIADEELAPRLADVLIDLPELQDVVLAGRAGAGADLSSLTWARPVHDLAAMTASASDMPVQADIHCHTLLMLAYTSGTTGPSKASMLSHAAALSYGTGGIEAHGYRQSDVFYVCLPLFHVNALLTSTATALVSGASVVLAERFSASNFFDEIRACKATTTNLLGAMTNFLWSRPPQASDADNALRLVSMSPLPKFTPEFEKRFGLKAVTNYGLSDFGTVTSYPAGSPIEKLGSIGKPRSYFEARIIDENDMECAPDVIGEIALRTREPWRAATGYYKMPEATAAANRNQWFHTGDRAYRDADGYLWFVDRKKDCIRRRGENISAFEVEQVITSHPAVGSAAVFPVSTAEKDEEVGAAVALREGAVLTERELIEHCAQNMSYFMVPRYIQFMPELPTTMNQKIEKFKLKQAMEAALDTVWDRERAGIVLAR